MNKKKQINVKSLLRAVLISAVTIAFFIGIVLMYYNMLYNKERELIIKNGETSAKQTATEFDEYLATSIDAIELTAYTLDGMLTENKTDKEILEYLVGQSNAILNTIFENTTGMYGYINGKFVSGSNWTPPADFDSTQRPWYIKAMSNKGKIVMIEPYRDAQTGDIMMALAKTLNDGKSVVAFDMTLNQIQKITEESVSSGRSDLEMIIDPYDIVIAHSDKEEFGKNYNTEVNSLGAAVVRKMRLVSDDYFELDYQGSHYIAYSAGIVNDWRCVSVKNASSAFGSLNTILIITVGVIVLIVVTLGVLLLNNVGRRLTNERLSKQLSSTADIYISLHEIDFVNDTFSEVLNNKAEASKILGETRNNCQQMIRAIMTKFSDETTRSALLDFVDFTKLDQRLKDTNTVTCEFMSADKKWRKARYIVSGRLADGRISNAMFLIEDIDKEKSARDMALDAVRVMNEQMSSVANIYFSMHDIDLLNNTYSEMKTHTTKVRNRTEASIGNAQQAAYNFADNRISKTSREKMREFLDFSTLDGRLRESNTITEEFLSKDNIWCRARFIVSKCGEDGTIEHVLWLVESIDEEKRNRDEITEAAKTLSSRISGISNIYMAAYECNLTDDTFIEIKSDKKYVDDFVGEVHKDAQNTLYAVMESVCDPSCSEDLHRFIDMTTLEKRLDKNDTITIEYMNKEGLWRRGRFVVSNRDETGKFTHVLWLTEDISAEKAEREKLTERISTISDIYLTVHEFDLASDTFTEIKNGNAKVGSIIGSSRSNAREIFAKVISDICDASSVEDTLKFCDLSTLAVRLKNTDTITTEYMSTEKKWYRGRFIVSVRDENAEATRVLYLSENIDTEKSERDVLNARISSISNIFNTVHEVDLENDTFSEIKNGTKYARDSSGSGNPNAQATLQHYGKLTCAPSSYEEAEKFFDFSTLPTRLKDIDTVSAEFENKDKKWRRARFIVSKRDDTGKPTHLLYLTEDITAEKAEREKLTERISSIANIYMSVHEFDIVENTVIMIKLDNQFVDEIGQAPQPHGKEMFRKIAEEVVDPEFYDDCIRFFDFSTLSQRMRNSSSISIEFRDKNGMWGRGRFVVSKRDENGKVTHVLYLTEDITAEKAERDRLIDASERALAASEAKSSFLSNMSHEIRTPINAVLGMNEMILRECDDKNILGYSESIRTAGTTLLGLVNDILDFSKIEAGKMEIIPVDYDLSSVINDLVNMIQTKADNKGLKLKLDISKEVPKMLHGDEVRIKQVVTNILTNAVKYTEQGFVTFCIDYRKLDDEPEYVMLSIAVKDTGIGIKKDDMKKLFSEFDRIEEKRNRNVEGTGLGMSITKRLLEMMDSQLQVESIYGLGSMFSFELKQKVVAWNALGDYEAAYKASLGSRKKYRERFRAPEAQVLVVDDTPMNLVVFTSLLKQTGIKIDTANSGDEGLSLAFDKKYDIIFLDHMMPDKDGIQTFHELRARKNDPNLETPVICLTANAISGAREKYLAEGFDNYLTKPIDSVKLEEMLLEYLPPEKVLRSEENAPEQPSGSSGSADSGDIGDDSVIPGFIRDIDEIDVETGIKNCGGEEAYIETIKIYAGTVEANANDTERFWLDGDIKNATIKIHAMKSSSRIIGATDLGELAQELENAGHENDAEKLGARIDELLERYRRIGEALAPLINTDETDESELPMIGEEDLRELYTGIREFLSVNEFSSAVEFIENLKKYSVPESERERRKALIKAADDLEYEMIPEIMEKGE
ncbi:MAG: response regulator [Ruminiclostridium sp.]|nr:response regulator [Ruminiclostridium sp.]